MATQTKTLKLIKNQEIFEKLIAQHKKLTQSVKDSKQILVAIEQELLEAIPNDVTEIQTASGKVELISKGGNITWEQKTLIADLKNFVEKNELDGVEFVGKICALKPREGICTENNFDPSGAKKVADLVKCVKIS